MQLLFHKDVFIPEGYSSQALRLQKYLNKYFYSRHFTEHLSNTYSNRSHKYLPDIVKECIDTVHQHNQECFEIELTNDTGEWVITKYCCRIPYIDNQDLVIAVRPRYDTLTKKVYNNMIVTAWLNQDTDNHKTLDSSKYCSKCEWEMNNNGN